MLALVDCNNFYCACERVFNPGLINRPVVVLSNNDGCVIARSEEAKELGIVMGTPEYLVRRIIDKNKVAVFSSNYTLYGDMSDRVMKILSTYTPRMEVYSIDEAFLDFSDLRFRDLSALAVKIREEVVRSTGIAVSIGIGKTRTLAKMANRLAKKKSNVVGVHWLYSQAITESALRETKVTDVWGIGHQYTTLLSRNGFDNAWSLLKAPDAWIRKHLGVMGLRLIKELQGIPAREWEHSPKPKKNVCISRAFGKPTTDKGILIEAVSNYAAICAEKLRREKSCAARLKVFVQTNQFRIQDRQYSHAIDIEIDVPTGHTTTLIKYALRGLDIIFRPGLNYMKAGVMVMDLISEETIQAGMFIDNNRQKEGRIDLAVDRINKLMGKEMVRHAVQGFDRRFKLKTAFLSQKYTTDINEVLHVKI